MSRFLSLALLATVVGGCGLGVSPPATDPPAPRAPTPLVIRVTSPPTPPPSAAPATALEDLGVGDCFDPISDKDNFDEIDAATLRACDSPHLAEVIGVFELDAPLGAPYPGEDELVAKMERRCLAAFRDYVGIDYYRTDRDIWWYPPTVEEWAAGNRRAFCTVEATSAQPLQASVRDARR